MMRLTLGFSGDAPQHDLAGRAAELLTRRYLAKALETGATRYVVVRGEFLEAVDADVVQVSGNAALAEFVERVRAADRETMVHLRWWPDKR
jgi:hypothetical protein